MVAATITADDQAEALGHLIALLMAKRQIYVRVLAAAADVSVNCVEHIIMGRPTVAVRELAAVCGVLGLDLGALVERASEYAKALSAAEALTTSWLESVPVVAS